MDGYYLKDPNVVRELTPLWVESNQSFFGKLRKLVKWYKTFCIQSAKDRKREGSLLKAQLSKAQETLHVNPNCNVAHNYLAMALENLQQFEAWLLKGQKIRSRVKWKDYGNKVTKEFFQYVRQQPPWTNITKLVDFSGVIHTTQVELESVCLDFYYNLYAQRTANLQKGGG